MRILAEVVMSREEAGRERMVVAMSGGVDSSMAAALLLDQGHEVIGVTMRLWDFGAGEASRQSACCSLTAVEDARRVCNRLGIPYYVMDLQELFAAAVIDDFIREYGRGRTPNPCIRCNQSVKFDGFLRKARELGADRIATGHYARVRFDAVMGRWVLSRAVDSRKDQSYALYMLTQEQLASTRFPLGALAKEETRRRAADLGLAVAAKPDSQEICFVPDNDYGSFLRGKSPGMAVPGPVVDRSGAVLGEHPGICFFTIGQKRGLKLPLPYPMCVVEIRPETNTLVVGREDDLLCRSCLVEDVNWIAIEGLDRDLEVTAKVRYNMIERPAVIHPSDNGRIQLEFREPQRAITPGQAAVFYLGEDVVGGGTVSAAGLVVRENG